MELHLLEKFVAVAEELHFGNAARRLNISQPPVSQAVQRLEELFDAELLERTRRSVRLTAAGAVLLEEARSILARVEEAGARVRQVASGLSGSVRLGFVGPAVNAGLPGLVRRFAERHQDLAVELVELTTVEQLERLSRRELDVGLVRLFRTRDARSRGLDYSLYCREPYVLALPREHRLAARRDIALSELAGVPLILFPRRNGPELHDAMLLACRDSGFSPHIVQEVEKKSTTLALVGAGIGCAFVPASAEGAREDVVFRPVHGPLPQVELYWVWERSGVNPARNRFLEFTADGAD